MSVFAVLSTITPNRKLEAAIQEHYPNDHYKLSADQWVVCAGGTSQDLSRKLGIDDENGTGPAMIFSYF